MHISPTLLKILTSSCQSVLRTFVKEVSVLSFYETGDKIRFNCLAMLENDGTLKSVLVTLPKN